MEIIKTDFDILKRVVHIFKWITSLLVGLLLIL
jgi:hypothetical protein